MQWFVMSNSRPKSQINDKIYVAHITKRRERPNSTHFWKSISGPSNNTRWKVGEKKLCGFRDLEFCWECFDGISLFWWIFYALLFCWLVKPFVPMRGLKMTTLNFGWIFRTWKKLSNFGRRQLSPFAVSQYLQASWNWAINEKKWLHIGALSYPVYVAILNDNQPVNTCDVCQRLFRFACIYFQPVSPWKIFFRGTYNSPMKRKEKTIWTKRLYEDMSQPLIFQAVSLVSRLSWDPDSKYSTEDSMGSKPSQPSQALVVGSIHRWWWMRSPSTWMSEEVSKWLVNGL